MKTSFKSADPGSPTVIISGFPGVGKSHAYRTLDDGYNGDHIMDSDSSQFSKKEFPQNYIEHIYYAVHVWRPDILLVSSHKDVRERLEKLNLHFVLVYPHVNLRGDYIQRYTDRPLLNPFTFSDRMAFIDLIYNNWFNWINDCKAQKGCTLIEMDKGMFLTDVIRFYGLQ